MPGIRIVHSSARSSVVLVPIMSKPFFGQSLDRCPSCHLVHLVKTVHLWVDADGTCIVSQGVLKDLKSAGMPSLSVVAEVLKPPPLQLGVAREKTDQSNRKIVQLGQPVRT